MAAWDKDRVRGGLTVSPRVDPSTVRFVVLVLVLAAVAVVGIVALVEAWPS